MPPQVRVLRLERINFANLSSTYLLFDIFLIYDSANVTTEPHLRRLLCNALCKEIYDLSAAKFHIKNEVYTVSLSLFLRLPYICC